MKVAVIGPHLAPQFWFHSGSNAGRRRARRAGAAHGSCVWLPGFTSCCVWGGRAWGCLRISCSATELPRRPANPRGSNELRPGATPAGQRRGSSLRGALSSRRADPPAGRGLRDLSRREPGQQIEIVGLRAMDHVRAVAG